MFSLSRTKLKATVPGTNEIPGWLEDPDNPDKDVLKARLMTMGVVEHAFMLSGSGAGSGKGMDRRIYDLGEARDQR